MTLNLKAEFDDIHDFLNHIYGVFDDVNDGHGVLDDIHGISYDVQNIKDYINVVLK